MEPFVFARSQDGPGLLRLEAWMRAHRGLSAGMTTRLGGVSGPPWDSLNCALHVGDDPERVRANRERVAAAIDLPFEAFTCAEQVHGCDVAVVTARERGRGRNDRDDAIRNRDALVTNVPDVWLAAFYADCVPIWLFDPVRRAVGLAHAGWKGTALDVGRRAIDAMREAFGTDPADVRAVIGPSIGGCCYEVDEPVAARMSDLLAERGESPGAAIVGPAPESDKYRLDLKEINRILLKKAGISPLNIEISEWCTGCRTDLLYSHRREGGRTGRMMAWIALTDESKESV